MVQTRQPYPGLRPYLYEEADLFFGRSEQINRMLTRLDDDRFLAVVGGSGSGKSSLVRAGLLPTLEQGYLPDAGTDWSFIIMRPGGDPFGNLASAFLDLRPPNEIQNPSDFAFRNAETQATLRTSPKGFLDLLNQSGIDEERPLLLLVDQFEEIFRFRRRTNENSTYDDKKSVYLERNDSTAFVNLLLTSAEVAACEGRPLYVVVTMRSDFIGDCEVFPGLPLAVSNSQFLVPRMTRRQLQEVIEKPLIAFNSEADPSLVNRILNDTGTAPDQLPLMQHALMRTFFAARDRLGKGESAENVVMTLADYEKVGRFSNALSRHLEEAWQSLDPTQQQIARRLFLCLSERDEVGLTRRIATVDEIASVSQADPIAVIEVVKVFQERERNFIISSPLGQIAADSSLDISHEALLRRWSRLQQWLDDEERSVSEYRRVADAASLWKAGKADLLSGRELARAQEWKKGQNPSAAWARRHQFNFSETIAYLGASEKAELEQSHRDSVVRRWIFTGMVMGCLLLAGITCWALREKANAENHRVQGLEFLANSYVHPIGQAFVPSPLASQESATLWDIASTPVEDRKVRELFLRSALDSESSARQLRNRLDLVAHALVGLDNENHETLLPVALRKLAVYDEQTKSRFLSAAQLCPLLSSDEADEASIVKATSAIEMAIQGEQNSERLSGLAWAMGGFGDKLPNDVASRSADVLLNAMTDAQSSNNKHDLARLGQALGGLGRWLSKEQADKAARMLLEKIERESDSTTFALFVNAFGVLSPHLSEPQVARSADRLVDSMKGKDSRRIVDLGQGLIRLGNRLPESSAGEAAEQLIKKIEKTRDLSQLKSLRGTLGDLGDELSKGKMLNVAEDLCAKLKEECDKEDSAEDLFVSELGFAVGGMGKRLPKAQADAAADLLLERMNSSENYYDLAHLSTALRDIGERLSKAKADDIAGRLLGKNALKSSDPNRSSCFAIPFERVSSRLSVERAEEVAEELIRLAKSVLERNGSEDLSKSDRFIFSRYLNAIGGAHNGLSDDEANEFARTLISLKKKTTNGRELYFFRLALGNLAPHLNQQLAQEAVQSILVVNATRGRDGFLLGESAYRQLLNGLSSAAKKLDQQQMVDLLKSPLCIGAARKVVLRVLEEETGGQFHSSNELLLISVDDKAEIPTEGRDLFIVAKLDGKFYFRIFDSFGDTVVDEYELKHLVADEQEVVNLENLFESVTWAEPTESGSKKSNLSDSAKNEIIFSLASLFELEIGYDIWKFVGQADKWGLDVQTPPVRR